MRGSYRDYTALDGVRILIVDDHKLFAEAVSRFLEQEGSTVVGTAADGRSALAAVRREHPDVVVVDLNLPDADGMAVGARILEEHPGTKVLAVTGVSDRKTVRAALDAGFHGFLSKSADVSQFVASIASAVAGQVSVPHELLVQGEDPADREAALLAGQLTEREREVLALLAEGAAGEEIARRLSVSPNTVRTHVHNVLTKLGVHSRLEAAAFAVRHGLVRQGRSRS